MRSVRLALPLLLAAACTRPVTGRDQSALFISDLQVEPSFIRADVPVDISFRLAGVPPQSVVYDIAGQENVCQPERGDDGRYRCRHTGLTREATPQGAFALVLSARDPDGRETKASAPITIDFDCPRLIAARVTPEIASPGMQAVVTLEVSEPLRGVPRVTRAGRDWALAAGSGQTFTVTQPITVSEPAAYADIVVRLVDRAGNTSADCGADGRLPFAVDHLDPVLDRSSVLLTRDAPGAPTTLSAGPGSFVDDVAVAEVRVLDATGAVVLARLTPRPDGSLHTAQLPGTTSGRVQLEVVDVSGKVSPRTSIPERWRLSLGAAATPEATVRTAVRRTPPAPSSAFLRNRTADLAPSLLGADARSAHVRARIGFERSGSLPNAYENLLWIAGGWDQVGKAIVTFGGTLPNDVPNTIGTYYDRLLVLRWNQDTGQYDFQYGPPYERGQTPSPRGGHSIAFDGRGCGIMFGGYGFREIMEGPFVFQEQHLNDVWELCHTPGGYRWTRISPQVEPGSAVPILRRGPIAYDPAFDRWVVVGGYSGAGGLFPHDDAFFLERGATPDTWRWRGIEPLPSTFGGRHSHLLYFDPVLGAMVTGLGYSFPRANNREFWVYRNGQWTAVAEIPQGLRERQGFGFAYDEARRQLVLWGDNDTPFLDPDTWFLTGTATNASSGWRRAHLDPPVPRAWPTLVYDAEREVTVAFGGRRFDGRFVPPDVHTIITQPSWPFLLATVDLDAPRPRGIERLRMTVRASGGGDGDGVGPGATLTGGVILRLWDHEANEWVEVGRSSDAAPGVVAEMTVDVREHPERFVSQDGVVPVVVTTIHSATEALEANLEVDLIDGHLELRPGVALP